MTESTREDVLRFRSTFQDLKNQIQQVLVGQDNVVESALTALFAGGHVLLEGVPGIGKTLLARTLGEALHLDTQRVQFTPDLMPADILGNMVLLEGQTRQVQFQPGPVHTNLLLADEINRATPKTQSALLEAMQEQQVTVGGETRKLPQPFMVMATQNPIEQEGTYPLPEAQLDRFLFKVLVSYPKEAEYATILDRTTGAANPTVEAKTTGDEISSLRALVREVPIPEHARDVTVRLVMATQPGSDYASERVNRFVQLGSSPRGAQALILGAKVNALRDGRFAIAVDDVKAVALPALRHRVLLNFEGIGEGLTTDDIVAELIETLA